MLNRGVGGVGRWLAKLVGMAGKPGNVAESREAGFPGDGSMPGLRWARTILGGLLLIGLLVAIWWLGPRLEILGVRPLDTWREQLVATSALIILLALLWGARHARRARSLLAERRHVEALEEDPVLKQVEAQESALDAALAELTDTIGEGKEARYHLPWYLVLGASGVGKSSLIEHSGQHHALRDVAWARHHASQLPGNIKWWLCDRAVLIEPDGELVAEGQEADEEVARRLWEHAVDWLARQRPRQPLDGVVLVLDGAELIRAPASQRQALALLWRRRLRELMEQLGTRPPVHVVFTRMDQIHGFDEVFRHYSREERREPLGFSFSAASIERPGQWEAEFVNGYDAILTRLWQRLPEWLLQSRRRVERVAMRQCLHQLSAGRERLAEFLNEALSSDRISTPAMVRGTYFVSPCQKGVPVDAFAEAIDRRYGIQGGACPPKDESSSVPFFSERLFERVIYPEAGLAEESIRSLRHRRRHRRRVSLVCLLVSVVLVGGWAMTYRSHSTALADARHAASTLLHDRQDMWRSAAVAEERLLEPLDRLRGMLLAFGDEQWGLPWHGHLGLVQGRSAVDNIAEVYLVMLEKRFLPAVFTELLATLDQAEAGSQVRLEILRLVRMMSDASGRQPQWVRERMAERWQREFPHRGELQERLLEHLDFAMAHSDLEQRAASGDLQARELIAWLNARLAGVQESLARRPIDERVVADMMARSERRAGREVDLRQVLGPEASTVFVLQNGQEGAWQIPGLMTREGIEEHLVPNLESVSSWALVDLWVLGAREDAHFSEADRRRLRQYVEARLADEYRQSWRRALDAIELVGFSDIGQAIQVSETLLGPSRPLGRLLDLVDHHTRFHPDPADEEAVKAFEEATHYRLAMEIEHHFSDLHGLLAPRGDERRDIELIDEAIAELRDYLRQMQESSQPGLAAYTGAMTHLARQQPDPIHNLERIAREAPPPVDRLLGSLSEQSRQVVLAAALAHLEDQWQQEVVAPFQRYLAGRFPLAPGAQREVSLRDFESFFAPEGTLHRFQLEHLAPFIDRVREVRLADGSHWQLQSGVLDMLELAEHLRDGYFDRNGLLDVEFYIRPLSLSANKRRSILNVDGQLVDYRHGNSQPVPMVWPNSLSGGQESRVTLVPAQVNYSPRSLTHIGAWGWFRLLGDAQRVARNEREVELRFDVDGGSVRYQLTAVNSRNPFAMNMAEAFVLPTQLYANGAEHADEY